MALSFLESMAFPAQCPLAPSLSCAYECLLICSRRSIENADSAVNESRATFSALATHQLRMVGNEQEAHAEHAWIPAETAGPQLVHTGQEHEKDKTSLLDSFSIACRALARRVTRGRWLHALIHAPAKP
jgi:hypothetical protein